MRTSGLIKSTPGRRPVRSRKWSTTASLARCSTKWVFTVASGPWLMVEVVSMARVPSTLRWSSQEMPRSAS